jgi:transcriptional regulator with XRE-family HTH domain
MQLWDIIRFLRAETGLTLMRFGDMIGCSWNQAARIERPYSETRCSASIPLLKRIAEAMTNNERDREELYDLLRLKLSRMILDRMDPESRPLPLPDTLYSERLCQGAGGMPDAFLARFKKDLEKEGAAAIDGVLPPEVVTQILEGNYLLSRGKVKEVAAALGQPPEEYLRAADYITDMLKRLLNERTIDSLLAADLPSSELVKMKVAIDAMVAMAPPRSGPNRSPYVPTGRKRGRPRKYKP